MLPRSSAKRSVREARGEKPVAIMFENRFPMATKCARAQNSAQSAKSRRAGAAPGTRSRFSSSRLIYIMFGAPFDRFRGGGEVIYRNKVRQGTKFRTVSDVVEPDRLASPRSVPFGMNWRNRPLFSDPPQSPARMPRTCASSAPCWSRSTKNGPPTRRPTSSGNARMHDPLAAEFPDLGVAQSPEPGAACSGRGKCPVRGKSVTCRPAR